MADVKFFVFDYEWVFNVLLNDLFGAISCFHMFYYVLVGGIHLNAPTSAFLTRLDNPQILRAIHTKLREFLFKQFQGLFNMRNVELTFLILAHSSSRLGLIF